MSTFFKPYEGKRPFLFVSYAHRQSNAVVETIRILHDDYRVWYDEGIPAGRDWPACIAQHMDDCEGVLFFVSERAFESENCFSEMMTAFRQHKPILVIWLEHATVPQRWASFMEEVQEIPISQSHKERAEAILNSGFVTKKYHYTIWEKLPWKTIGLVLSVLFFIASAGMTIALASGKITITDGNEQRNTKMVIPDPTAIPSPTVKPTEKPTPTPTPTSGIPGPIIPVSFADPQMERAVQLKLGVGTKETIYRDQFADIRELIFCGNLIPNDINEVSCGTDGNYRVNGAPIAEGRVQDISVLQYAVNLEVLYLIKQPMQSVSKLSSMVMLRELSLAGCKNLNESELGGLKDLPRLETLHLEHTGIKDLTSLENEGNFPRLKIITVSRDMLPLIWSKDAGFDVVLLNEAKE